MNAGANLPGPKAGFRRNHRPSSTIQKSMRHPRTLSSSRRVNRPRTNSGRWKTRAMNEKIQR